MNSPLREQHTDDSARKISTFSRERLALLCTELKGRLDRLESASREPIAIVGMACRFPAGVTDADSYWELLRNGIDAITEVPPNRWDLDAFYDPDPHAAGKTYSRVAGHLDEVGGFDPFFFNISPREAVSLDPQYRLLLEVAWEALENAGLNPQELRGSRSGVILGIGADDYAKIQVRSADPGSITAYTGTGNAYCYGAGRLSYFLGLHGPNFPVDTACSSSLVATHLACRSLRARECDMVITGGVHLILSPIGSIFLSKARALSPTGRCRSFDADADGFTRGEGCGIVVLKRLSDALANHDRIHAVIRGSAINHDGPSSGFTVPNGLAQQAVIQAALKDAGVSPLDVGFVETHGTGTSLGDPIEVRALAAVLGRSVGRAAEQPLVLGAVKANVGHLEPAAGVAGLIKAVLALQHREIPPQVHFKQINPEIALDDGPFVIPTRPVPWPDGERPRVASVSSFGLSGTNAHLILEEAARGEAPSAELDRSPQLLTLSARTETALRALAGRYERHIQSASSQALADICFTANTGRAHFAYRLAAVAESKERLCGDLRAFARATAEPTAVLTGKVESGARQRIAFVFAGEGQERVGMGRDLYTAEPVFHDAIASCEAALTGTLEHPLAAVLYTRDDGAELLVDATYGHSAIFAVEYALLQLWRSWGIEPSAVLGHGSGEYVAATAAGVLSLEDALRLVVARARVTSSQVPVGWRKALLTSKQGDVRPIIDALAEPAVVLAVNSARHAVIAAPESVLHDMRERLDAAGIRVRPGASGSALFDAADARARLRIEAARVTCQAPQIPMVSAMVGDWMSADADWASHWLAHASHPVRFGKAIETLSRRHRHFLEIGPKPVLATWGRQCLPTLEARWLASLDGEDDRSSMLASLAALHVAGFALRWSEVHRPHGGQRVSLPTYPFEREHYWIELSPSRQPPALTLESEALADAAGRATIERLLQTWNDTGSQAIVRMVTAPFVFFGSGGQSLFYVNQKGASMVAVAYVGPPPLFDSAAGELMAYARDRGLQLVVIAHEGHADRLRKLGFARSPVGVWQSIDARSFSVHAPGMRRLRSKVNSYARRVRTRVEEHRIGSDPAIDPRVVELMEQWVGRKKRRATFVSLLRDLVLSGRLPPRHRVFLCRRGDDIDSVILISPIEARNGYLLDLEFYAADMPNGCLEFSIVNTIELLKREGHSYFSFGATYGTQLERDPHEDPRIRELLTTFHEEGILNEDGNFEFKKKFQPETVRMYVCTMPDADHSSLPDTLMMLAAPDSPARATEHASARRDRPPSAATAPGQPGLNPPPAHATIHPLLGWRLPLASATTVFQSTPAVNDPDLPWLSDHRVLDAAVVPAAAYIAMGLEGARRVFPGEYAVLESLSIAEALVVDDRRSRCVQLTFEREADHGARLGVWSTAGPMASADMDWTQHVSGHVTHAREKGKHAAVPGASLLDMRSGGLRPADAARYYEEVTRFGFRYGPSFQVIQELWDGHGEALARISLPDRLRADAEVYLMHPVLLDGCLQVQGAGLLASRAALEQRGLEPMAMYVPVGIERVEVTRQSGTELWVHAKVRPVEHGRFDQIVGDITVWDAQGEGVARIEGLAVRHTRAEVLHQLFVAQERQVAVFCRLGWRAAARGRDEHATPVTSKLECMVFVDAGGTGAGLAELLRARGDRCVMVRSGDRIDVSDPVCWALDPSEPEHFEQALGNAPRLSRIVYAWSADAALPGAIDAASLATAQRAGCGGLLHLVQALVRAGRADSSVQLWVVTRATQSVDDDPARVNPTHAAVWGLGRSIAQEHPQLWGGMIDLDPKPESGDAHRLLDEIVAPEDEDHIAYAGGQRYVARLLPTDVPALPAQLRLRNDATYLVTGGVGGLGRTVARWMVDHGAGNLLLVGRAPINDDIRKLLAEVERAGARTVRYESADVSREQDVTRILAGIGVAMPPLRGIVHTAGVLADAVLLEQSWPRFLEVMAPKIAGAWHLHRLTAQMPLDHFVLFSSTAALLGAAGQGNYAAANSFMGALAHLRRSRGLPAVTIDWGPWDEVGMAAAMHPRAREQRASRGIRAFSVDEALRLLERAMLDSRPQIGILSVDWGALLAGAAPLLRRSSIFKDLIPEPSVSAAADPAAALHPVLGRLVAVEPAQRRSVVHAYLVEQVIRLLGAASHTPDPHEPLTQQGFDSLMALELRDLVEADLQVSMPILTFFRSNSIGELTTYLLGELDKRFTDPASAPAQATSPAELLAQLDQLSEGELDLALRRELER